MMFDGDQMGDSAFNTLVKAGMLGPLNQIARQVLRDWARLWLESVCAREDEPSIQ